MSHLTKTMPIVEAEEDKERRPIPLEVELLDDIVLLYHLGISARFKQAALHLQNQVQTITQLEETNKRIKRAKEQV